LGCAAVASSRPVARLRPTGCAAVASSRPVARVTRHRPRLL